MGIFNERDKIQRWRYNVKQISILLSNQNVIEIPIERITQLDIEENYEEYYFPLIKLSMALEPEVYYEVLKDKLSCLIYMRIDKYYMSEDSKEKSLCKNFINHSFSLIMDDGTDDLSASIKEEENKTDYVNKVKKLSNDLHSVDNVVTFYLFKDNIKGTKLNINKVLCNANVTDAIAYLATAGNLGKVLLTQPDNVKVYKELLIPNMSILKAFTFIDSYYGLYKSGSIIWFGIDHIYIGPYNNKGDTYIRGEIPCTNIVVPKSTNSDYINSLGSVKKSDDIKSNYVICDYKTLNIQNESISNDYINANNIESVDSYEDSTKVSKSKATSKNSNFKKVFKNKTENEFITDTYTAQSNAKSVVITAKLQDFDISVLTPNKKFNMIFEDSNYTKKYNGDYILSGVSHSFIKDGEDFSVSSTAVLRKTK